MEYTDAVADVRASVERSAREGTARLRFDYFTLLGPTRALTASDHVAGRLFRALERRDLRRRMSSGTSQLDAPEGQIDFRNNRSLYGHGRTTVIWRLFVDGAAYGGTPGEWGLLDREAGHALRVDGPFWLLALVSGTVEVNAERPEQAGGLRRYEAVSDFRRATEAILHPIAPMSIDPRCDLARLPIEVWLDDQARIRRIVFFDFSNDRRSERRTELELWGYGELPPIPKPAQPPAQA
jgi:hypothetical protein